MSTSKDNSQKELEKPKTLVYKLLKCIVNPESDNVANKYKAVVKMLSQAKI